MLSFQETGDASSLSAGVREWCDEALRRVLDDPGRIESADFRLSPDLVAQKYHAVFEQLQVPPILEDAPFLPGDAGQTSIRTSSTTPASIRECMRFKLLAVLALPVGGRQVVLGLGVGVGAENPVRRIAATTHMRTTSRFMRAPSFAMLSDFRVVV